MGSKLSRNQVLVTILVPLLTLLSGWVSYVWFGAIGLIVPFAISTAAITVLLIELRNYHLGLFVRRHEETKVLYDQLEALIGLNAFIRPVLPLPGSRGFAASPDLLVELVRQVMTEPTELVLEASCGTSTLVLAYSLQRVGKGKVIALEHDGFYAERTRRAIHDHGLDEFASVVHAPLVEHLIGGERFLWYDLSSVTIEGRIDLMVVDGPPNTIQPLARFPAFPLFRSKLKDGARIILDDGNRPDEEEIAKRWAAENVGASIEQLRLETGAWLIRLGGQRQSVH